MVIEGKLLELYSASLFVGWERHSCLWFTALRVKVETSMLASQETVSSNLSSALSYSEATLIFLKTKIH